MKRGIMTLGGVLIIGVVAGAFLLLNNEEKRGNQTNQMRVVKVTRGSLQTTVSETGTLEPSRTVDIKSQFSGEVGQLFVREGDPVESGQLLAVIRQEPSEARRVAQLRAGIQEQRINVDKARRELVRMRTLFKQGFIPRKELESAQQEHQRSLVRLELAERELLLALGRNQDLYQRYLVKTPSPDRPEEFQIRTPISGTILKMHVQKGEIITSGTSTVGGGTVLMKVADLSRMLVKAKINEVNIARVQIDQPVDIRLDALPGQQFLGKVVAISSQGVKEDNIVTYEVTMAIQTASGNLRPMLTANIDIVTEELQDVLTVPLEVLQTENGNDFVDVMVNGTSVKRKVRVALRTESKAVIVQGLEENEQALIPSYGENRDVGR